MVVADSLEDKIHLARRVAVRGITHHQLGDDLVGAGEINHRDLAEIDDGQRATIRLAENPLDGAAHGGAGGARHEIRVELAGDCLT